MQRRTFLTATSSAGLSSLCGCTGSKTLQNRSATVAWTFPTEGIVKFEVTDERVWLLGKSKFYVIARSDGSKIWELQIENPIGFELDTTTVYIYGKSGLAAIERSNGSKRWEVSGSFQGLFLGLGVIVAYTWDRRKNVAFDAETGTLKWEWSGNMLAQQAQTIGITSLDEFTAVDLRTGRQLWAFQKGIRDQYNVELADDRIYVGGETEDGGHTLYAVEPETGSVIWRTFVIEDHFRNTELIGDTLYITWQDRDEESGFIAALDPDSGSVKWKAATGSEQPTPVPFGVEDDTLVVTQSRYAGKPTTLRGFDVETGSQKWTQTNANVVMVADNRIVLAEKGGRFRGIDTAGETKWTTKMEFVPMVGTGGNDPVYIPPRIIPLGDTFAAGFEGTNSISEWQAETGNRTWKLRLEDVFKSLRKADGWLFASTDTKLSTIQIETSKGGQIFTS